MEPIIDHIEVTGVVASSLHSKHHRAPTLIGWHAEVEAIGATIVSAPREYPDYTPAGYYAFYFKDPDGIKYEVVSTGDS